MYDYSPMFGWQLVTQATCRRLRVFAMRAGFVKIIPIERCTMTAVPALA